MRYLDSQSTATRPLARILSWLAGIAALALTLFFSVILFAVFAVLGLVIGGFIFWKTRNIRKQMREQQADWQAARQHQTDSSSPASGEVIEGEVIRTEVK